MEPWRTRIEALLDQTQATIETRISGIPLNPRALCSPAYNGGKAKGSGGEEAPQLAGGGVEGFD